MTTQPTTTKPNPPILISDPEKVTEWRYPDQPNFLVVVAHYTVPVPDQDSPLYGDGPNRWNVRAFIYPKHPRFAQFSGKKMWQPASLELPLHCGPSQLIIHRGNPDDIELITAYQVSADYNHLGDSEFTHLEGFRSALVGPDITREKPFRDAAKLFLFLKREVLGIPHPEDT